jgi:hypothetical protein
MNKIRKTKQNKTTYCQELEALAFNPSYSGSRDQEDGGSKPAPGK